jgi:voltage-gated sodium channel
MEHTGWRKVIYNERLLLGLILVNVGVIYLHTFDALSAYFAVLDAIDVGFTVFFAAEILTKVVDMPGPRKLRAYLRDPWNRVDFCSVLFALPSIGVLVSHDLELFAGFATLRSLRVFKFLRIIEYIPNGKRISSQVFHALKSISFIVLAFVVYSTIISIISVSLFKPYAPSYFHDGFDAFFTIYNVFSGDGFTGVVAEIGRNCRPGFLYFTKAYFVLIGFTGSILGLSLINSIFVDAMVQAEKAEDEAAAEAFAQLREEIRALRETNAEILERLRSLRGGEGG